MQRRLGSAGFSPGAAVSGDYCEATARAVSAFQIARGLEPTGVCDDRTWAALIEANWTLGDRLLTLRSPLLRGDDVSDLQARLARLGFDCGKVDGIYGNLTAAAFERFQRNCGLAVDGVCGADSVRLLDRLARQSGTGPGVAMVREGEVFCNASLSLVRCRVVVGQFGGLSTVARLVCRQLRSAGALVVPLDEPDAIMQATTANTFAADVYVGLATQPTPGATVTYYAVPAFESVTGKALAERLAGALRSRGVVDAVTVTGQRLPILRETRMPAVLCRVGEVRSALDHAPAIAAAVNDALTSWVTIRTL